MRALSIALLLAHPFVAEAGTLRGTIFFPQDLKASDARPLANWRVENGLLGIVPAPPEPRTDAIVVLIPERAVETSPVRKTIETKGLKLEPRVAVAPVGSTFEFKNTERTARTIYLKDNEKMMPPEPLAPGQTRFVKITVAGEYEVRDADYPHAKAVLLVVSTPYFKSSDDKGLFTLDVPDGRYTLRVFYRGIWAASQTVDVNRVSDIQVRGLGLPDDAGRR